MPRSAKESAKATHTLSGNGGQAFIGIAGGQSGLFTIVIILGAEGSNCVGRSGMVRSIAAPTAQACCAWRSFAADVMVPAWWVRATRSAACPGHDETEQNDEKERFGDHWHHGAAELSPYRSEPRYHAGGRLSTSVLPGASFTRSHPSSSSSFRQPRAGDHGRPLRKGYHGRRCAGLSCLFYSPAEPTKQPLHRRTIPLFHVGGEGRSAGRRVGRHCPEEPS